MVVPIDFRSTLSQRILGKMRVLLSFIFYSLGCFPFFQQIIIRTTWDAGNKICAYVMLSHRQPFSHKAPNTQQILLKTPNAIESNGLTVKPKAQESSLLAKCTAEPLYNIPLSSLGILHQNLLLYVFWKSCVRESRFQRILHIRESSYPLHPRLL